MRSIDHVVVIFNPKSTRAKKDLVPKFQRQLKKAAPDLKVTVIETKRAGHAEEIASTYANENNTVLLCASGDGVYNEVVNGVFSKSGDHPLLGVIPSGNANDHFHSVAKGSMIERIIKGKSRSLDVLSVEFTDGKGHKKTRFAHSYIGLGLTSYIRKELDEKDVNSFTEKIVATRAFVDSKPVRIRRLSEVLEIDSLVFANISTIAKFFKIKNSSPQDGKFEVHIVHHSTQLHKAGEILRIGTKKSAVKSRSVAYAFTLLDAGSIQLDGEVRKLAKNTRVVVSLEPSILHTVI